VRLLLDFGFSGEVFLQSYRGCAVFSLTALFFVSFSFPFSPRTPPSSEDSCFSSCLRRRPQATSVYPSKVAVGISPFQNRIVVAGFFPGKWFTAPSLPSLPFASILSPLRLLAPPSYIRIAASLESRWFLGDEPKLITSLLFFFFHALASCFLGDFQPVIHNSA